MEYTTLGKSDLHISGIGFGCMSLKDNLHENERLIHRAIELGINYFDTAELYDKGLNEEQVGKSLRQKRDKVIIATKVGNKWRTDGSGWDWNPRKEYILAAVEQSLKRLQTDYIDLYQLHGGTMEDPVDETIEAFEQLVAAGKIRYYGISSIRPVVIRRWVEMSNIVSVMMQYSLLDRRPEEAVLPLLLEKNIGVLARGSVAGGLLADKPAAAYLQYEEKQVATAAAAIRQLSTNGRSNAQTAIQFVLHHPAITAAIVGIRTMEQLQDAVAALGVEKLSATQITALSNTLEINKYTEHR
jgi:aryl-alcohol dehydrogenase-like predicted oxidoreductase